VRSPVEAEGVEKILGLSEMLFHNTVISAVNRADDVAIVVPQRMKAQRQTGVANVPAAEEGSVSNAGFAVKERQQTHPRRLLAVGPGTAIGDGPRLGCGVEPGKGGVLGESGALNEIRKLLIRGDDRETGNRTGPKRQQ
jgi:hypothetical protein